MAQATLSLKTQNPFSAPKPPFTPHHKPHTNAQKKRNPISFSPIRPAKKGRKRFFFVSAPVPHKKSFFFICRPLTRIQILFFNTPTPPHKKEKTSPPSTPPFFKKKPRPPDLPVLVPPRNLNPNPDPIPSEPKFLLCRLEQEPICQHCLPVCCTYMPVGLCPHQRSLFLGNVVGGSGEGGPAANTDAKKLAQKLQTI